MKRIVSYIAISLNGKIAKSDGSVHWLESIPNPKKIDHGYKEFIKNIDTTIQGNSTYQQLISWGIDFPYTTKHNYVFTRNQELVNTDHVEFISEKHVKFTKNLKQREGKDIWLIGGGQINTLLFNASLIDEFKIFVMPIVIPDGIELFGSIPIEKQLTLVDTKKHSTGVVELNYKL